MARVRDKDWLGFRVTYVTVTVRVGLSVRVGLGDGGRLELNQFRVRVRYGGADARGQMSCRPRARNANMRYDSVTTDTASSAALISAAVSTLG